jgi:hypothetical protein
VTCGQPHLANIEQELKTETETVNKKFQLTEDKIAKDSETGKTEHHTSATFCLRS